MKEMQDLFKSGFGPRSPHPKGKGPSRPTIPDPKNETEGM